MTNDQRACDLTDCIGHTPLLPLRRIAAHLAPVEVYVKAEWFNPSGSVKDRAAWNIVRTALADGRLTQDKTLLDATSGNMGIAYAMLGAALGFRVRLVMPANVTPERKLILSAYGAEMIFTDPMAGSDGAIEEARRIYAQQPAAFFYANQYDNPANWLAHYHGTAEEVWAQTAGRITHFVAALGTSGTFVGCGRRLRALKPDICLVALQPDSPLNAIEGWKHMPTAITPQIYDSALADALLEISTEDAQAMACALAKQEGLFVSPSAGGAVVGALRVAEHLRTGVVVAVLADAGYKYASERFWQAC